MLPSDYFEKNLEMWEKFTGSYMDMMFKTVEKSMDQSTVLKEQVDKTVDSAMETQQKATLATLEALQRQMESLNAKVDELIEKQKTE